MSSVPNLCLHTIQDCLSLNLTPHIHLVILISAYTYLRNTISFSLFIGHISLSVGILLHRHAE